MKGPYNISIVAALTLLSAGVAGAQTLEGSQRKAGGIVAQSKIKKIDCVSDDGTMEVHATMMGSQYVSISIKKAYLDFDGVEKTLNYSNWAGTPKANYANIMLRDYMTNDAGDPIKWVYVAKKNANTGDSSLDRLLMRGDFVMGEVNCAKRDFEPLKPY